MPALTLRAGFRDPNGLLRRSLAPSNHNVLWLGSGEGDPRNSVSYGDGVYRSTDGGMTWTHLGLDDTERIKRIVVHPKDPDTALVCALGHEWGANAERGVFKTTDAGKTWKKVLRPPKSVENEPLRWGRFWCRTWHPLFDYGAGDKPC